MCGFGRKNANALSLEHVPRRCVGRIRTLGNVLNQFNAHLGQCRMSGLGGAGRLGLQFAPSFLAGVILSEARPRSPARAGFARDGVEDRAQRKGVRVEGPRELWGRKC